MVGCQGVMTKRSNQRSEHPAKCPAPRARNSDWDPIRGLHQGQWSKILHQKAGHMEGTDQKRQRAKSPCLRGPSTYGHFPTIWGFRRGCETGRTCCGDVSFAACAPKAERKGLKDGPDRNLLRSPFKVRQALILIALVRTFAFAVRRDGTSLDCA
jgi:hypothetical protein